MNEKQFIITKNRKAANTLLRNGFTLFSQDNDTFVFVNSPNKKFADMDKLDLIYTNRVFI